MLKSFAIYAAMIAAAAGIHDALLKMSRDADAPIRAIVQAQASQPFGYQIPGSKLDEIMRTNATTIAADRDALAKAEQATP